MNPFEQMHQELSTKYSYKKQAPIFQKQNYRVYQGTHKELNIDITIKIKIHPEPQLLRYLKKFKDSKVENTIKFFEIFQSPDGLYITTEQVTFSNLKNALSKYRKLDDFDAVFMSKIILNIHVDLLRAGFNWFGTEEDIEFTDNGLKLSWNNSIPYETQNPFPIILSKLAGKMQIPEQKILPFPKSKVLQDLINVSGQNASQIGLNNNMKKKQKLLKKKGRNWIALKQYKNDFQYYEQSAFFGVHKEIGFVRIKSYTLGQLDQDVLNLNKTKTTFTKVIDNYNQGGKTFIISQYSNDGTLHNYANKLRANSISLKEEQIQFFFYSLFQPLKLIQDSSIKSLSMLHIKNIYIENGIPKIGQPIPLNQDIVYQLKQKADIPDFYHTQFKKNPKIKQNTFDTYSLGVLMYKLMYTEYPIFPDRKVHIPTTPNYNQRLKTTLELFLNEGGMLKDLQKKIEVSDQVAKQVKLNKNKLMQQKDKKKKGERFKIQDLENDQIEKQDEDKKQGEDKTDINKDEDEYQDQNDQCCKLCCAQLQDPAKHRSVMLETLQESPYSRYRICIKILCVLLLYFFLFYFFFLRSAITVLNNYASLQRMNVTISTINYEITVSNPYSFYSVFNLTDRSLNSLVSMGCFINTYTNSIDYTPKATSTSYSTYVVFSILLMIIILIFKAIQLSKFDLIKTLYNMSILRANFNMTNYLVINFFIVSLVNDHYVFFQQISKSLLPTCLGVSNAYDYGSTDTYYSNSSSFSAVFVTTIILHFAVVLLHLIMVIKTESIRYTRLYNPILIFMPFLLVYTIICRVGVIKSYFYPSLVKGLSTYGTFFTSIDYISIIGILPEILFLFEFIIEMIVDWIFWLTFDKRRKMLIHDMSSAGILI